MKEILPEVEIRPRWDWKVSELRQGIHHVSQLKSDQDGIERQCSVILDEVPFTSWNQTKMGLKVVFQYVSYKRAVPAVEIRPRWDWKKSGWVTKTAGGWCVEIRPRWDWKAGWTRQSACPLSRVEIRPRWDWKVWIVEVLSKDEVVLKSDQDGIESRENSL